MLYLMAGLVVLYFLIYYKFYSDDYILIRFELNFNKPVVDVADVATIGVCANSHSRVYISGNKVIQDYYL
jgi:hypothetical protein